MPQKRQAGLMLLDRLRNRNAALVEQVCMGCPGIISVLKHVCQALLVGKELVRAAVSWSGMVASAIILLVFSTCHRALA